MADRVGLDGFLAYVAAEMSWDTPVSPATTLDDDLCVDSVARYELLCVVEDLGVMLDEADLGAWQTVGDLYDAYTAAPTSDGLARQLPPT
jgi:acyl carrier protein